MPRIFISRIFSVPSEHTDDEVCNIFPAFACFAQGGIRLEQCTDRLNTSRRERLSPAASVDWWTHNSEAAAAVIYSHHTRIASTHCDWRHRSRRKWETAAAAAAAAGKTACCKTEMDWHRHADDDSLPRPAPNWRAHESKTRKRAWIKKYTSRAFINDDHACSNSLFVSPQRYHSCVHESLDETCANLRSLAAVYTFTPTPQCTIYGKSLLDGNDYCSDKLTQIVLHIGLPSCSRLFQPNFPLCRKSTEHTRMCLQVLSYQY